MAKADGIKGMKQAWDDSVH